MYQESVGSWPNLLKQGNITAVNELLPLWIKGNVAVTQEKNTNQLLNAIYTVEKEQQNYMQKELADEYIHLFATVRNQVIVPLIKAQKINIQIFALIELIMRAGLTLPSDPEIDKIITDIDKVYDRGDSVVKFHMGMIAYQLSMLNGNNNNARELFIERLSKLIIQDIQVLYKNNWPILFKKIFSSMFKTVDELITTFTTHIFSKEQFFSTDNIIALKSKVILGQQMPWVIYNVDKRFLAYYEPYKQLFKEAINRKNSELVLFLYDYISHLYLNLTGTQEEWRTFNDEMDRELSTYVQNVIMHECSLLPVQKEINPEAKLRIGFVRERTVANSPFKVFFSFLSNISEQDEYDIFVYDIERITKSPSLPEDVEKVKKCNVTYWSNLDHIKDRHYGTYYSHLDKNLIMRDKIIEDNIDILIADCAGEQVNFLFSTRTAPKQIYWSHGNYVFDIDGIDKRMIHTTTNVTNHNYEGYVFYTINLDTHKMYMKNKKDNVEINRIKEKYQSYSLILGTIGRYVKLENDKFIDIICRLLQKYPNIVYLACGSGEVDIIKSIVEKYGVSNRFIFEGFIDPEVYGHIIDLYIDSFPYHSGESLNEVAAKGVVYVTLYDKRSKSDVTKQVNQTRNSEINKKFVKKCEKKIGIPFPDKELFLKQMAFNYDEFFNFATFFIENEKIRKNIGVWQKEVFLSQELTHSYVPYKNFKNIIENI